MKYVVYGLGISGTATAKFLAKFLNKFNTQNANASDQKIDEVIVCDDNETNLFQSNPEFDQLGIQRKKIEEINFDKNTVISFAPGIPLYFPKRHKILDIVAQTQAQLACDIEIFYRLNSQNNFIAITGTNGKSTTTALSGFIFQELGFASAVGGNIGVAVFDLPQKQQNFSYIFETSSYQLDLLNETKFGIAALLNITPDHIDRHGSMENYIAAKKRIFRNQNIGDFALIDVDNINSKSVFDELKNDKNFAANIFGISTETDLEQGFSLVNGHLSAKIFSHSFEQKLTSEFLRGKHNEQNMACAFAIAFCHYLKLGLEPKPEKIIAAIKKFTGLRHRMQIIGQINDINFINDSKATNAESTENALKSFENIFWILGGKAKEGGINSLKPYFKRIHKAYLIGESSTDFADVLQNNSVNFELCQTLENAIKKSFSDASNSNLERKNILLSPACASFDQWKNFEQRGDFFCQEFENLKKTKI